MPNYQVQHPLAERFRSALNSSTPASEFAVACAVSEFVAEGESPDVLLTPFIAPLLEATPCSRETLLAWFAKQGFSGPADRVTAAHSDLNFVLEYRQGIPISIAVIVIETARRAGLAAHGVNFPGHFLLNIEDEIINPLTFDVLSSAHLEAQAAQAGTSLSRLMQPASAQMIGLRMLNNLKALAVQGQDFAQALEIIDLQIACCDDQPELLASLHFERGEYWQQLGLSSAARDAYAECAAICPYPELAAKARELAQRLSADKSGADKKGGGETLH